MSQDNCLDRHIQTSLKLLNGFNSLDAKTLSSNEALSLSFAKLIDDLLDQGSDYTIQRLSQLIPEWNWLDHRKEKRRFFKSITFDVLCKRISSLIVELNILSEEEANAYIVEEEMEPYESFSVSSYDEKKNKREGNIIY